MIVPRAIRAIARSPATFAGKGSNAWTCPRPPTSERNRAVNRPIAISRINAASADPLLPLRSACCALDRG